MEKVIITRTFSKLFALAGYRFGYMFADPQIIKLTEKMLPEDRVNIAGAMSAIESINDQDLINHSLNSINKSREMMQKALNELNLAYIPSTTNFIFHYVEKKILNFIAKK